LFRYHSSQRLGWLRGESSVFVPEELRERNVALLDFEHPDRNLFQVTDEWRHKRRVYANRADVVFLINGIPVAIAETKGASKANGMKEGVTQIRRYHQETPELLAAPQLFEVTQLWDFFARQPTRPDTHHDSDDLRAPGRCTGCTGRAARCCLVRRRARPPVATVFASDQQSACAASIQALKRSASTWTCGIRTIV
jgi:hypothetical protein